MTSPVSAAAMDTADISIVCMTGSGYTYVRFVAEPKTVLGSENGWSADAEGISWCRGCDMTNVLALLVANALVGGGAIMHELPLCPSPDQEARITAVDDRGAHQLLVIDGTRVVSVDDVAQHGWRILDWRQLEAQQQPAGV